MVISTASIFRAPSQVGGVREGGGTGEGGQSSCSYQSEWLRRGLLCHRAQGLRKAHWTMGQESQADSGKGNFSGTCRAGTRDPESFHSKAQGVLGRYLRLSLATDPAREKTEESR